MNTLDKVVYELRGKNFIFLIGNGGSASTCTHFANDLMSSGYKAISLADNVANMTRIANDRDYKYVFEDQLKVLFRENDALIAISASGRSFNLIRAVDYVNSVGGLSIAIVGFDGGALANICKYVIHIPTGVGEYEKAEDEHLKICHQISKELK